MRDQRGERRTFEGAEKEALRKKGQEQDALFKRYKRDFIQSSYII